MILNVSINVCLHLVFRCNLNLLLTSFNLQHKLRRGQFDVENNVEKKEKKVDNNFFKNQYEK